MISAVPTGAIETPYVQTEAVSTNAPSKSPKMSNPAEGNNAVVVRPEEKYIDQAINQIFRSSSQVLLNCKDANGNPYLQGARKVIQNMHDLWKVKNLCEVTLECKDGVLYAHKLVMAAYSESLCKRFADYPLSQAITISLREYPTDIVCALLEFMYTIELKLTYNNVGDLLSLAKELGIPHVVNCCLAFLGNITLENCFVFLDISIKHGLNDVMDNVDRFLCEHFGEIITLEGFLRLSNERLVRLLNAANARNVKGGELQLFLAIVRWIEYRRTDRLSLAPVLLRCVKLALISARDLVNHVEKVDFMTGMPECFHMLYAAMTFHALHASGGTATAKSKF